MTDSLVEHWESIIDQQRRNDERRKQIVQLILDKRDQIPDSLKRSSRQRYGSYLKSNGLSGSFRIPFNAPSNLILGPLVQGVSKYDDLWGLTLKTWLSVNANLQDLVVNYLGELDDPDDESGPVDHSSFIDESSQEFDQEDLELALAWVSIQQYTVKFDQPDLVDSEDDLSDLGEEQPDDGRVSEKSSSAIQEISEDLTDIYEGSTIYPASDNGKETVVDPSLYELEGQGVGVEELFQENDTVDKSFADNGHITIFSEFLRRVENLDVSSPEWDEIPEFISELELLCEQNVINKAGLKRREPVYKALAELEKHRDTLVLLDITTADWEQECFPDNALTMAEICINRLIETVVEYRSLNALGFNGMSEREVVQTKVELLDQIDSAISQINLLNPAE